LARALLSQGLASSVGHSSQWLWSQKLNKKQGLCRIK
jgi:hypothetical protein